MNTKKNLAIGHILDANDANSNEQESKKASSEPVDVSNGGLRLLSKIVDSMRDVLWRLYNLEHPISLQKNPRGAGRKSYDVCFMFNLLVIQSLLDLSDAQPEYSS